MKNSILTTKFVGIALVATALWAAAPATRAEPESNVRSILPEGVKPKAYQLFLQPDLAKRTFSGKEKVTIEVSKETGEIVLNAAELNVKDAVLEDLNGNSLSSLKIIPETEGELLHLVAQKQKIAEGSYALSLNFNGTLNAKLRGFYYATYKDSSGVEHPIATTQFEPTDARRMFPCFDQPNCKATYKITAAVDPELTAISNSPVAENHIDETSRKRLISFEPTPPISSYLLALIIGPFEATPATIVDGVPIRVWCAGHRTPMGAYAQQTAAKLLHYYNDYFGVPYPAKKLDLIAIPDFQPGAMENLAAITFKERGLLLDDKSASNSSKMAVASVVAHEMAHMWFGDLVTMEWWNDLWLNEAFATWMATKATDILHPEWHYWNNFAVSRSSAMVTDSLSTARPIQASVKNPSQAMEMFDAITYIKGASILRMLECCVTDEVFEKGIQNYIQSHKFGNATTQDLWDAISYESKMDISRLMNEWISKPGYPLIKLANETEAGLPVAQEQFLLLPGKSDSSMCWQVPLSFRTAQRTLWGYSILGVKEKTIDKSVIGDIAKGAFTANAHGNGYYRVQYTPEQLRKILDSISQFNAGERLNMLVDQWELCYSGRTPLSSFLTLIKHYSNEGDVHVTSALIGKLSILYDFCDQSQRPAFGKFVCSILQNLKKELGWEAPPGESDLRGLLREAVFQALGTIGQDQDVIAKANQMFADYRKDSSSVNPNILNAVTRIVAFNGGPAQYEQMTALWHKAETPETEARNLMALGYFREPQLVSRTLEMCLTDKVRTQDSPSLVGRLLDQTDSKRAAWAFMKDHWEDIIHRYPPKSLPRLFASVASLTTADEESDVAAFTKDHPVPTGKIAIANMLEKLHANVLFLKRSAPELRQALNSEAAPRPVSYSPE